jgi:hypothetical protein
MLSRKSLPWKLSSPCLLNQSKQIRAIDGHLSVKHSRPQLTPHDVGYIQSRFLALLLDAKQEKIHQIRVYLIQIPNARAQSVAKDTVHDIQEWNELGASDPPGRSHSPGVTDKLRLVCRRCILVRPETNGVVSPLISNVQTIHEVLPINLQSPPTSHP